MKFLAHQAGDVGWGRWAVQEMFHKVHIEDKCGTGTSAAPKTSGGGLEDRPGWGSLLRLSASKLLSLGKCATANLQFPLALNIKSPRATAPSDPLALPLKAICRDATLSPKYVIPGRMS